MSVSYDRRQAYYDEVRLQAGYVSNFVTMALMFVVAMADIAIYYKLHALIPANGLSAVDSFVIGAVAVTVHLFVYFGYRDIQEIIENIYCQRHK